NGNKAGIGPKASPMPDAFIRIAPDDSVTVLIKHLDMGQGVTTGITTIVAAAAEDWKVPASEITVHKGRLSHRSGKSGRFGQFAEKAAHFPLPSDVTLKDPAKFGLIGAKTPRIDSTEQSTGKAIYAQDIRRPAMLPAVIARPPRFGGTVNSFDASGA